MQDRIAAAISVVFSPFLVPIATVLVVAQSYATTGHQAFLWILIVIKFNRDLFGKHNFSWLSSFIGRLLGEIVHTYIHTYIIKIQIK